MFALFWAGLVLQNSVANFPWRTINISTLSASFDCKNAPGMSAVMTLHLSCVSIAQGSIRESNDTVGERTSSFNM